MSPVKRAMLIYMAVFALSTHAMRDVPARTSSRDVKLPKSLVTRIEREYREYLKVRNIVEMEHIRRTLLDITVELTQDRKGALTDDVKIATPLGGGVIDLAEHVTPLKGTFRVKMTTSIAKGEPLTGVRVFYISDARIRRLAGESYGSGCGKLMEVTDYFTKAMADGGFEVYTADQRYVSVLSGTFVITQFETDSIYAGIVSFTDSRYPEMSCD